MATLEWDDDELQDRIEKMPLLFFQNMHRAMDVVGHEHIQAVQQRHRALPSFGRKKSRGAALSRISGRLNDSFDHEVSPKLSGITAKAAPGALKRLTLIDFSRGVSYAPAHEYGKVITPKNAKVLTVPLSDQAVSNITDGRLTKSPAFTAAGDQRYSSPRQIPDGFWTKSKNGKAPIFFGRGVGVPSNGPAAPYYVGVKRVKIPPRLKFRKTFEEQQPRQRSVFLHAITEGVAGRENRTG